MMTQWDEEAGLQWELLRKAGFFLCLLASYVAMGPQQLTKLPLSKLISHSRWVASINNKELQADLCVDLNLIISA